MIFPGSEYRTRLEALTSNYLDFLADHRDDLKVDEKISLYGRRFFENVNGTSDIARFLWDYVYIGNDSSGHEFLLRRDGSDTVFWEESSTFIAPHLSVIHPSFPDWLAEGCPLPQTRPRPIPLEGPIWLLAHPPGGMDDLLRINKIIALNWAVIDLKLRLHTLPALLIKEGRPFNVYRALADYDEFRPLLGFSKSKTGEIESFSDYAPRETAPA